MLDTNILFSALFYPSKTTNDFFKNLKNSEIYIAEYTEKELFDVTARKHKAAESIVKDFLASIDYTLIKTPENFDNIPQMRDVKDMPILAAAIAADVDFLVTGDKDFFALEIDKPTILTMADFVLRNEK